MSLHIRTLSAHVARLVSGLVLFVFLAPANGSGATCPTCNTWKPLRIGAGGYITGLDIASDGTKVVRTDTYGAYIWTEANEWEQLVTATSIPAADQSFDDLGGGVYEIAIAASNPSTFYMVWHGYVYKTTNRGQNWTRTSFARRTDLDPNDGLRTLGQKMAIDPANANVVYVGTVSNGVWRTLDGGTTWSQVTAIPAGTAAPGHAGIAFDPSSGVSAGLTKVIYVPSWGRGVWRSADAGSSWSNVTGSGPVNVGHAQVATDGIYYCADGSSAYRYAAGAWTTLHTNGWFNVTVDPANPAHIILGGGRDGDGNTFRQSFDRGNTWVNNSDYYSWSPGMTKVANDVPWLAWTKEDWFSFGDQRIDPTDGKLYQAEGIGVWKTSFPATWAPWTWTSQSKGIEQLVANGITSPPGGKPIVASWDRALFVSEDPDVFPATHGPNRDNSIVMGWGVDYAFGNPSFVAANVTWWGVNESGYSNDGGQTWTQFSSWPFTDPGGGIAVSTPTNMVAWAQGSGGRPYYTTNGGASWTQVQLPGVSSWANFHYAYYLARHVVAADRVNAGTFYLYHTDYGVFRTTNGGATWSLMEPSINTGGGNGFNAKLKTVPGKAGHLFFTAGDQGGSTAGSFMRSTNGGDTWTAVPNVLEVIDFGFGKEAPGGSYPTIFIAGWVNNVYGFWRSDNEGQSWTKIGDFPLGSLDVIKTIEGDKNVYGTVYVGYAGSGYAYGTLPGDAPPVVSVGDATVTEGNAGTTAAQFTVSLSAGSTQTVSVNFAPANGTAQAGSDYLFASGSVTFSPGSVQRTINVNVNGDTAVEPNETFFVNLSAPTNATLGDAQGTGTIVNDDTAPLPSLSINDVSVTEGNSGTVTAQFTLSLSAASTQTVTVNYALANGIAQAGSDYVAASGNVSFSPGSLQQTLNVTVNGDTVVEPNETFTVNLSGPANATLGDAQGAGTIVNDDTAPLPSLSINDVSVTEGNSGTVTAQFAVSLSAASTQTVTVSYALANGTAQAGSDYVAASGSVSFSPGSVQQTISVTVNGDTVVEPNETFSVNLSGPANATLGDAQGVGTIVNDDTAAALPTLVISDDAVTEGNSGTVTAQFTVSLSAPSTQTVTVNYSTAPGTAQAGSDYVAPAGTLTFSPGSVQQTVNVTVNGDAVVEPNETFVVFLGNPTNATLADAQGIGTIIDDDSAPVGEPVVWVGEGGVAVAGNNLTKTAASAWGNAGASSTKTLASGDGFVEFTVQETNTFRLLGLSQGDFNWNWDDIDFALYPLADGTLRVYERGILRSLVGTYASGDKLRVAVSGNVVRYYRNGTLLYTSGMAPAYPLLVDTSLYTNGATLAGVVISGAWATSNKDPVTWTSVGGATASANNLTKTAAAGWGNSGAVSTRFLALGDGFVEHTVQETNTYRMLGLSRGNASNSWDDIDFAVYPMADATLRVYEKGVLRGSFGGYAAGDRLRIAVTGGVVRYYRNGTLLYSSSVPPTYPLIVDTALFNTGATLANVVVSRNWVSPNNEPIVWASAGGVAVSGNNLTKTAASGWGNAGAVSSKSLLAGDGYVEHTVKETNTFRLIGLSNGDSNMSWDDIDYGLYTLKNGTLRVYEKGVHRGTFGTYGTGDKLRVAVVAGVVRYYRNGLLLYSSPMAPVYPLLVDTALFTTGATLGEVMISRQFN